MSTPYGSERDEEAPLIANSQGENREESCWQRTKAYVHRHKHSFFIGWVIILTVTAVLTLSFHFSLRAHPTPPPKGLDGEANPQCISDRSWFVSLMLSIFLGEFGIDRFYLGYVFLGILKLVTAGLAGIWWMVDILLIALDVLTDNDGCHLR